MLREWGASGFGDVAEVDADAVPDVGGAAHAVDEDVVVGEVGGGFGVGGAPAVEAGFGGGFVGGLRDGDERDVSGARAAFEACLDGSASGAEASLCLDEVSPVYHRTRS